jgi:hypothetical protein
VQNTRELDDETDALVMFYLRQVKVLIEGVLSTLKLSPKSIDALPPSLISVAHQAISVCKMAISLSIELNEQYYQILHDFLALVSPRFKFAGLFTP